MEKLRILLIDDEEIVLIGWREELKSVGYDIRMALDGERALEMLKEEKADIVITDLVMPNMDGVEVCKRIKALHPETVVVFVSGHPQEIEKKQMDFIRAGGRDELLRKPILKDEILDVIKKITKEME